MYLIRMSEITFIHDDNRMFDSIVFVALLFKCLKDDAANQHRQRSQALHQQGRENVRRCKSLSALIRASNLPMSPSAEIINDKTNSINQETQFNPALSQQVATTSTQSNIVDRSAISGKMKSSSMKEIAAQVVRECLIQNQLGNESYSPLMDTVIEKLRDIDGIKRYWIQTETQFYQYRSNKQRTTITKDDWYHDGYCEV